MHVHISEKMLEDVMFRLEKDNKVIRVVGYHKDNITSEACGDCGLEKLEKGNILELENVKDVSCGCEIKVEPVVSLKVDFDNISSVKIV